MVGGGVWWVDVEARDKRRMKGKCRRKGREGREGPGGRVNEGAQGKGRTSPQQKLGYDDRNTSTLVQCSIAKFRESIGRFC